MIGHEIITASAGAGKTWSLTLRYIRLLAMGADPCSIIALTFSRKAAGEFFTAILRRLATAAENDDAAAALARDAGMPALRREDFRRHLAAMVREMPSLMLGTMDSFFVRIARSFPLELGLAGDFAILDDHQQGLERERVLSRVFAPGQLNEAGRREFLYAFQQATWGKEEVRLKRLLGEFLKDWQNYFFEAPDEEVWGDPARIWPGGRSQPDPDKPMSTLIAEARSAMNQVAALKDSQRETIEKLFAGLETHTPGTPAGGDWKLLLAKLMEALPDLARGEAVITIRSKVTLSPPLTDKLHALMLRFVHDTFTVCLHQTRGIHRILALYDRHYHDMVRRQGRLTFQDVQLILRGDISAEARGAGALTEKRGLPCARRQSIDYRLDARYAHWLLDEFQDTSRVQWSVLQNLCDEAIQDTEGARSFFAVGDEKQSIFTWRGAEPGLFGDILAFYNQSGERIKVTPLAHSQRSGPAIISMVNRLCGNLPHLMDLEKVAGGVKRWPWQEHSSAHPDRTGCGAVIEVPVDKEIESADEAVWRTCAELLRQLQPLRRGLTCAVICHRNDRATKIANELRLHSGLEVVCESDVSIATDNPAAAAMLALLKAAAHPADRFSWQVVLMSPLGEVIAGRWPDAVGRTALARADGRRADFTSCVLRQVAAGGFEQTLRTWRDWLLESLPSLDSFSRARLDDLCRAAQEFDAGGSRDTDEFIAFAESWSIRESAHSNAVQVMTLHKSKGLTFDIVILPDLFDRYMYPHRSHAGAGRNDMRELTWLTVLPAKDIAAADPAVREALEAVEASQWRERLAQLYVAVTRAKRGNYILLPPPPKDGDSVTLARIVRHMLAGGSRLPLTIGTRDCEVLSLDGSLDWIDTIPLKPSTHSASAVQTDLFAGVSPVADEALVSTAPLPLLSPSSQKRALTGSFVRRRESRRFGNFAHALLSRIEWAEAGTLKTLRGTFRNLCPAPEDWQAAALASVERSLADPAILRAFSPPAAAAILWRERPFEAVLDGKRVSGIFDRVTVETDAAGRPVAAHLMEFKTGQLRNADEIAAAVTRHDRQTKLYRTALGQLTGLPASDITVSLLFTALPRLVLCEDAATAEGG